MKKVLSAIIVWCIALSVGSCSGNPNHLTASQEASTNTQFFASSSALKKSETIQLKCDHIWKPRNYQVPDVCVVCGEMGDTPLPPDFEEKGYTAYTDIESPYDYEAICYLDPSVSTAGKVRITDYKIIDSDQQYQKKENYEWRIARVSVEFNDANAITYRPTFRQKNADYYTGEAGPADSVFQVNYYGEIYECINIEEILQDEWNNNVYVFSYETAFQVPIGYDGCVLAFYNAKHDADIDNFQSTDYQALMADADTWFFRLADQ